MPDEYEIRYVEKPDDPVWEVVGGGINEYNTRHAGAEGEHGEGREGEGGGERSRRDALAVDGLLRHLHIDVQRVEVARDAAEIVDVGLGHRGQAEHELLAHRELVVGAALAPHRSNHVRSPQKESSCDDARR